MVPAAPAGADGKAALSEGWTGAKIAQLAPAGFTLFNDAAMDFVTQFESTVRKRTSA
jgi:hypothetical protein